MKLVVLAAVALTLAGCGLAREAEARKAAEQRAEAFKVEVAAAEADYGAKKITFGQMVSRAADAKRALEPNDPLAAESIYFAKLQGARVDKGEISIDEYRYAVSRNDSELASRRQTRAAQALTAMAAVRASQPPSMNCTSNQVGTFTYTNCN